jgi:hypothetical protein
MQPERGDMTADERIASYLLGWETGDAALLLSHTVPSFFFDDPNRGIIPRAEYEAYVAEIWAEAKEYRGDQQVDHLEDLSEIVQKTEEDGTVTVWFWWAIAGTPIEGSSLVKMNAEGVLSETICYYGRTQYANRAR